MERERVPARVPQTGHRPDRGRVPGPRRGGFGGPRTVQGLLRLQSSAGNRAVSRMLSVQRQDPDEVSAPMPPATATATAEPISSEPAQPTLSSADPEVDGRTVAEVGADLRGRAGRYVHAID
ncbi:MAG TPA: hypothetical protein VGF17_07440, partial [Phytomonospora sp.]